MAYRTFLGRAENSGANAFCAAAFPARLLVLVAAEANVSREFSFGKENFSAFLTGVGHP